MSTPNVHLVLNSGDTLGKSLYSPAPYQSTIYAAVNQNLVQGQVEKLSVNEVNFPYDIPNVQVGPPITIPTGLPPPALPTVIYPSTYNVFRIIPYLAAVPVDLMVVLIPGFYDGTQLAASVTAAMQGAVVAAGLNILNSPTCAYDTNNNLFQFSGPAAPTNPADYAIWKIQSPFTFGNGTLQKDLLSIMGFKKYSSSVAFGVGQFSRASPMASASAPLTFTSYIDICSPELCQFQELKTGNTTNVSRRTDIICRLYVANNISVNDAGYAPFIINRQFTNERMMRWTADNSIGNMTIQLYDDLGQPLLYTWSPRDFQITFNVYERERSIGSSSALRMA